MAKKTIEVKGITIKVEENDYVSLTDIAKQAAAINPDAAKEPRFIIRNWLRNGSTLAFIETWETLHNPDFNRAGSGTVRLKLSDNSYSPTPQNYIKETNAIGLRSKAGKYGGTYAHEDLALNFCYWLSPIFQVYFIKEFRRMKKQELLGSTTEWALKKIWDSANEIRVLVETVEELKKGKHLEEEE